MAKHQNMSSKKMIFLGFAMVLMLLVFLMIVWTQSFARNNQRLQNITDQLIETQHVFSMRDAAYQRAIILYRMVTIRDPFDRNDEYMAFKSLANKFIESRNKFQGGDEKRGEDSRIWLRARPMINLNAQLQNEAAELILEDRIDEARQRLVEQVKPVQDVVMSELTKLFEVESVNAVRQLNTAKKHNRMIYIAISAVSLAVILLGALIAWAVARRTNESETRLLEHTVKLRDLYALSGNARLNFEEQIGSTLQLGCRLFNMEIGKVCRIDPIEGTNTFLHSVSPEDFNILPGTKVALEKTICSLVYDKDVPLALDDVRKSEYRAYPCYEFSQLESYIAAPLYVNGARFGTVNFSSRRRRGLPFSDDDIELIKLVANWVSVALEREYVNNELQQAKDAAEMANRAKSGFLANMSHEIRTPLTAILGFSEILRDDDQTVEEREKSIASIIKAGANLQQIINDVLDLSKIEAEQLEVESVEVSPFRILSDIGKQVGKQARSKGLSFDIFYEFPVPRKIYTDPARLRQILLNICDNACKFTESGGITIEVAYLADDGQLSFSVTDTGIGMSYEDMGNIFSAFTQADTAMIRKYGGTGLGLCVSQQLARKMGGNISCHSEQGKGSQFIITVSAGLDGNAELVDAVASSEMQDTEAPLSPAVVRQSLSGNVLLAEDSVDNQQLISMYVRKIGASITVAENGKIAINHAMAEKFDLILMDMQMPVMGGLEAIQWLRQIGHHTPIVALTANAMKQDRDRCLAAGADGYLSKPIDLDSFYNVLGKYLKDNKQPQKHAGAYISDEFADDPEFQQLLQQFMDGLPGIVANIRTAAAEQDWDTVQGLSHNLKGVGGNYGFPDISQISQQINNHSKTEQYGRIESLVRELDSECQRIVRQHRARRAS